MISRVAVGAAPVSAVVRAASSRGDPERAGAATSRGASHAVASSRDAASSRRLIGPPRRRWGNATPGIVPPSGGKTDADGRRGAVAACGVAMMLRLGSVNDGPGQAHAWEVSGQGQNRTADTRIFSRRVRSHRSGATGQHQTLDVTASALRPSPPAAVVLLLVGDGAWFGGQRGDRGVRVLTSNRAPPSPASEPGRGEKAFMTRRAAD